MLARAALPSTKTIAMRGCASVAAVTLILSCGCATFDARLSAPVLPDRHGVELDQLVVHSNFELPGQHRLLQELNAQRADLSFKLGLPISDEPIHVYLFADAERFGRFMSHRFPDFPDRRAFFVETDTQLTVYAQWGDRVAEDLRHEVAHGYLHAVVQNLPLWLDEGLAEYFETPRGTHGMNRPHVEELVSLAKQGRWTPNLRRLEALETPAQMSQSEYAESWLWVHWLLESDPRRRQFLQTYLADLRRDPASPPLSMYLRQLGGGVEAMLVEHLRALEAKR
jgi:hypothetical protein